MDKRHLGFIGLGIMGKPMAKNLLRAGYSLTVYDIVQAAVDELSACGATAARSPREAAEGADVVITMLPNSPQVREVILARDGVIESVKPGAIVVDMSSIAPAASQEIAAKLRERGVEMLDAPVSGGEPKAVDGTLAIMVGGSETAFQAVKELLLVMGASATLVGAVGSGNATKLANQMIVALNIAALSEALTLAAKAGVDPERVFSAIRGGLAGSTVMEAKTPMILDGNFKPGFRIELHIKDLLNAMDTSHACGAPAPLTASVLEILQALKVSGSGGEDHSAIVKFYESLAGVAVRRAGQEDDQ